MAISGGVSTTIDGETTFKHDKSESHCIGRTRQYTCTGSFNELLPLFGRLRGVFCVTLAGVLVRLKEIRNLKC